MDREESKGKSVRDRSGPSMSRLRGVPGRVGACCLVCTSLSVMTAVAAEPDLTVLPVSHSLTIAGVVENEPIQMRGALWLSLTGWPEDRDPPHLSLWLSEDLAAQGGAGRPDIRLTNLTLRPEAQLENGKSIRVEVLVEDVQWPGSYSGKISYRVQGGEALKLALESAQERATAGGATEEERARASDLEVATKGWEGEVALKLDVRTKPRVVATETELTMNLVDCTWSCFLARLFLPAETTSGAWPVELRNSSLTPVVITPRARISRKENLSIVDGFGFVRTENEQGPAGCSKPDAAIDGTQVAIGDDEIFNFCADRSKIGPGSYEGNLLFRVRPSGEEALPAMGPDGASLELNRTDVVVKAKVDVRAGVFWVLVWVSAGIVAGRLNRQISTPEAQARLKFFDETVTLRDRIARLADETSKRSLSDRLVALRRQIDDLDTPDEEIRQALELLEEQVRFEEDLETLESEVGHLETGGTANASALDSIRAEIGQARGKVLVGIEKGLAEVKESIQKIRAAIQETARGGDAATAKARLASARARPSETPAAATEVATPRLERLAQSLAVLAGTRNLSVKARYWYLQPAATILLLFALAVYGVFLLYAGPDNSTFGANGIADYVLLFLWGFGSDIVSKRLGDVTFTRS